MSTIKSFAGPPKEGPGRFGGGASHLKVTVLAMLILSGYVWSSGLGDGSGRDAAWFPPMAAAQEPGITLESPAQLMRMKMREVCAHADQDRDGYLARSEFGALDKQLGKPDSAFTAADADHDGRLSLQECEQALGSS